VAEALTALMFVGEQCGRANDALDFYAANIPGFAVQHVVRIEEPGDPRIGDVRRAEFTIGKAKFIAFDSAPPHSFTFTPAISIWIELDSGEDIRTLYEKLSEGGSTHMPLAEYGFSQQYAWVDDRFGVSWQINLPFPVTD